MKRIILFFISISLLSCEKKEIDYTNHLIINEMQTTQIAELNNQLYKKIKQDKKRNKVFEEIVKLERELEIIKEELIWVCGGYKDSISGEIVNQTQSFYTEKYFYRKNFVKDYAINNYLDQIDKWDEIIESNNFESKTNELFDSYNQWFEFDKISLRKTNIFKRLKPIEALILISTIQRQLQVEKYNLLVNQMEK